MSITITPRTSILIRTGVYWLATLPVVVESAVGAGWDLLRTPYVLDTFDHLGYPAYLLAILGVWKVLGVLTLIVPGFPGLKEWAYAGIFFVYTGAAASHLAAGDQSMAVATPIAFAVFTLISRGLRSSARFELTSIVALVIPVRRLADK
ncbi:DoxX family protein [Nonomuraea sp. NPDC049152]|uniref:DoxX family protein n=1 Tax=Nonomuraea sp. NPDC049152 TaxID=3154350 RepID=UPI003411CD28